MKLSCPACGFIADADAFVSERGTLDMLAAALSLPANLAGPLLQYLRLFRPPKRALTSKRVGVLLAELVPPIKDARIDRRGRLWPAPTAAWAEAIDQVLEKRDAGKLTLPLRSHGYLFEVVVGMASAAEGLAEARQEDQRAGRTPVGGKTAAPSAAPARAPAPIVREPPRDPAVAQRGIQSMKQALKSAPLPTRSDGDAG